MRSRAMVQRQWVLAFTLVAAMPFGMTWADYDWGHQQAPLVPRRMEKMLQHTHDDVMLHGDSDLHLITMSVMSSKAPTMPKLLERTEHTHYAPVYHGDADWHLVTMSMMSDKAAPSTPKKVTKVEDDQDYGMLHGDFDLHLIIQSMILKEAAAPTAGGTSPKTQVPDDLQTATVPKQVQSTEQIHVAPVYHGDADLYPVSTSTMSKKALFAEKKVMKAENDLDYGMLHGDPDLHLMVQSKISKEVASPALLAEAPQRLQIARLMPKLVETEEHADDIPMFHADADWHLVRSMMSHKAALRSPPAKEPVMAMQRGK